MKISPQNITKLNPGEVFVFGSNMAGIHGAGAAKCALSFGAKMRHGFGMHGCTYAIATKDHDLRTVKTNRIIPQVNEFLKFARKNPAYTFLVTEIGCGLAGYTPSQIAPMFCDAPDNVHLPESFIRVLYPTIMELANRD